MSLWRRNSREISYVSRWQIVLVVLLAYNRVWHTDTELDADCWGLFQIAQARFVGPNRARMHREVSHCHVHVHVSRGVAQVSRRPAHGEWWVQRSISRLLSSGRSSQKNVYQIDANNNGRGIVARGALW